MSSGPGSGWIEERQQLAHWWSTAISDIRPGIIRLRGHDIVELLEGWDLVSVIWLMLRGTPPSPIEASLLQAAMVASVDHGPQAPSIAAARMAATCGVGLNNALATGVNLLGDVHGGAGQQCLQLYLDIEEERTDGRGDDDAVAEVVERWRARRRYLPGFGHRFHPVDPRAAPLLGLIDRAAEQGAVSGRYARTARMVEAHLSSGRARPIPLNIDGATAAVYGELGFTPQMARGLFCLSRSVGILAHASEEMAEGARIKGPMPRFVLPAYTGPVDDDPPPAPSGAQGARTHGPGTRSPGTAGRADT